jgi:nucleoid-associated protein YgaU
LRRALLGLALLGAAFALVALLVRQERLWQAEVRAEHDEARRRLERGEGPGAARTPESGWIEVVVGAPSGAEPLPVPAAMPAGLTTAPGQAAPQHTEPGPALQATPAVQAPADGLPPPLAEPEGLPDFRLQVSAGQVLSRIARDHYGTAAVALVEALAAYNGMESPDQLREGQVLRLPPREVLLGGE